MKRLAASAIFLLLAGCEPPTEEPMPSSVQLRQALDLPPPRVLYDRTASGTVRIDPSSMAAGQVGSWEVRFRVGAGGIARGGGILVDLPKEWLGLRHPLSKPVQTRDASAPHFLGVDSDRPEADLSLRAERLSFDSKVERYPHVLNVLVRGGALEAGDEIRLRFANTTAPFLAGKGEVRVAVDPLGLGEYGLVGQRASYRVRSGAAESLLLVVPSDVVLGERSEARATLFDHYFNPVRPAAGRLEMDGLGERPTSLRLTGRGAASVTVEWTPSREGILWVRARYTPEDGAAAALEADGNPVRVHATAPERRIFWGDIHSHSSISKDAIGSGDYEYARDVTHLDFFASTEHADDDRPHRIERNGITAREWSAVRRRVRDLHRPGRFATLLGYECNLLDGHRCVLFRSDDGVPWPPPQLGHKAANLWPRLAPRNALGIPHHLGRSTKVVVDRVVGPGLDEVLYADERSTGGEVIDWRRPQPDDLQPALEIFSGHGTSEGFDPSDPLAYEQVRYLPSRSLPGSHYARNAWANGHRVGVVAASDNHTAQPGLPHNGLTAVIAERLDRAEVFDAIASRRSYGTTGERILLDLGLEGRAMGEVVTASGPTAGTVFVAAPRAIRFAELIEIRTGDAKPHRVARWESPGRLLEARFELPPPSGRSAIYLRCELDGATHARVARGWSSPIFVEPAASEAGAALVADTRPGEQ